MSVDINVDVWQSSVGFVQPLRAAAECALQELGVQQGSLTIKLVGADEIRELNQSYAGVDEPTDVLSFTAGEIEPESGQSYLGDVVVSPDIAIHSAARGGHALRDELTLLTVHGVLHLLGYDHDQPERKREMWEVQQRILDRLGAKVAADQLP